MLTAIAPSFPLWIWSDLESSAMDDVGFVVILNVQIPQLPIQYMYL